VRNRVIILGLLLAWVSLAAVAADGDLSYTISEIDGVEEIQVTTPLANYLFSEDGGVMKSLFITFAPYGSTVTELLPGTRTTADTLERQYVADAEFPFALEGEGLSEGIYELSDTVLLDGELRIVFEGRFGETAITKTYTIRGDDVYTIDVQVDINNGATETLDLTMLLGKYEVQEDAPAIHYLLDGSPSTELLAAGSYANFGGIGVMNKSIVFFLSPSAGTGVSPFSERIDGQQRYGVAMEAASGSSTFTYQLYGGRRRFLLMEAAGIEALDEPGMGARLMIPVIRFLDMLFRATGNYGWAIILFTILTRVILFPLMRKQYHSMAKMQQVQPKLKRIQERFKDDKQLQQQRMMELYRKEGINPMGGCLPMLVQLPILILIWRAILFSAEMIHLSPGFLWIPDLALNDPYFILVIVTTAIMILQQWLMTPQTAGDSPGGTKYFGYIFPIFMAVLLWRFPAGLWLYYLLTTGAQVAQQAIVNREMAHAKARKLAEAPLSEGSEDDEAGAEDDGGSETGS